MLNFICLSVGDDVPQETVDTASVFLFTLFNIDCTLSRTNSEEIRKVLGPFPASAASSACDTVKRILSMLPEDWKAAPGEDLMEQHLEFGHNIVFKHAETSQPVQFDSSGYDTLSEDEYEQSDCRRSELFSGLFHDVASHSQLPPVSASLPAERVHLYSGEWLKKQCQSCCMKKANGGFEWKELYSTVFDVLSSSEDNSGIQNSVRHEVDT